MPDQKLPAFAPESYFTQGPFSDALNPQRQPAAGADLVVPGAKIPGVAAAAGIIDKFLSGVSQGRERQFRMQEAEQRQQVGVLNSKLAQIQNDPTRTDADKQAAAQPIYRALGQIMGGSIEGMDQKGGKKKKSDVSQSSSGAWTSTRPGESDGGGGGGTGVGHHLLGIAKDFATGLAGGKFPKELDPKTVKSLVGSALVDSDVALSKAPTIEALTNQFQQGMAQTAQGAQGKSWQEAAGAFDQHRQVASRIDPSGRLWQQTIQDYQTRFGSSTPGSKEYWQAHPDEFRENFKKTTGRYPSEAEAAEAVFGVKPAPQGYVSAKPIKGSDLNFDYDVNGNPRDPARYYLKSKDGVSFQPTDAPKVSAPQQAREDALKAYDETHSLPPGSEHTGVQTLDALREAKEKTTPGDVAKKRQLDMQYRQEMLQQVQSGRADMDTMADGVADGTLPPDLAGLRLYGDKGVRFIADLEKRHPEFSLKNARLDYIGQQSYMRTLNSQQQVRLRQAVEFPLESLNLIDDGKGNGFSPELSKHLDRSKYPLVNKAAMAAALNGAMGQEAQDAARNLDIQIRDLQAEMAVVYKGGNSPTDKGLAQAQEILNGNWNEESLRKTIELSRTNLKLRLNSIHNTLPYTIDGGAAGNPREPLNNTPPGAPGQRGSALAVNNVSGIRNDDGFVKYANPREGFRATVQDLQSKITGKTSTGLTGSSSLDDLVNIWTTGNLSGTGQQYDAGDVRGWLKEHGSKDITEQAPVSQIPVGKLAAAIAHFETGYDASPQEIDQADLPGRAERNAGAPNPFRKAAAPPNAGAAPAVNGNPADPLGVLGGR